MVVSDDYPLPGALRDGVRSAGVDTVWLTTTLFNLFVDEDPPLAGTDSALPGPGRVGLMTFQNPQALFYGIELVAI